MFWAEHAGEGSRWRQGFIICGTLRPDHAVFETRIVRWFGEIR